MAPGSISFKDKYALTLELSTTHTGVLEFWKQILNCGRDILAGFYATSSPNWTPTIFLENPSVSLGSPNLNPEAEKNFLKHQMNEEI